MRFPFKIVWNNSKDDSRYLALERRLHEMEKTVRAMEEAAFIYKSDGRGRSYPHPVGVVVDRILAHLSLDLTVTPYKAQRLDLVSTASASSTDPKG